MPILILTKLLQEYLGCTIARPSTTQHITKVGLQQDTSGEKQILVKLGTCSPTGWPAQQTLRMQGTLCPSLLNVFLWPPSPVHRPYKSDLSWTFQTCHRTHLLYPPGWDTDYKNGNSGGVRSPSFPPPPPLLLILHIENACHDKALWEA